MQVVDGARCRCRAVPGLCDGGCDVASGLARLLDGRCHAACLVSQGLSFGGDGPCGLRQKIVHGGHSAPRCFVLPVQRFLFRRDAAFGCLGFQILQLVAQFGQGAV
jgi:hypothetical protein